MNLHHLPKLPPDKANHFVYGSLAALVGVALAAAAGVSPGWSALLYAASAGVLKEVHDRATGRGTPDAWDAVATAAGGLPVALALWAA